MKIRIRVWNSTVAELPLDLFYDIPEIIKPNVDVKADSYIVAEGVLEIQRKIPTGLSGGYKRRVLAFPLSTLACYLVEEL